MRIRWKLLVLLLILSLVPLAVTRYFGLRSAQRLGRELAGGTRAALTEDAQRLLLQLVEDHSRLLQRESETLEHALRIQAREVQRCLASMPDLQANLYFDADYDETAQRPGGLVPSDKHIRIDERQGRVPVQVTYLEQVFVTPPGVDPDQATTDARRLSKLLPTYQLLHEANPAKIYWQYVALESGVHSCFPGHGGYPQGFDPRQREWYLNAKRSGRMAWNAPLVDASTSDVVLTASMPVARDGVFSGVTAIDVRIGDLIDTVELPAAWSGDARTMLVVPEPQADAGAPRLLVLVQQEYLQNERRWDMPVTLSYLEVGDGPAARDLAEDMRARRAGVRQLPLKEQSFICAYGPLRTGNHIFWWRFRTIPSLHLPRPQSSACWRP